MNEQTAGCFGESYMGGADFVLTARRPSFAPPLQVSDSTTPTALNLEKNFANGSGSESRDDEAELHHTDLRALLAEVVNRKPGGTAVGAHQENTYSAPSVLYLSSHTG